MANLFNVPREITQVGMTLKSAGYEAYLVGGCVRDLLQGAEPKDWDFTTNATPTEIIALFPHTFYENSFGTVGVVNDDIPEDDVSRATLRVVEVTPYRTESTYSDFRRPDSVEFSKSLYEDLERRDFTMNAIAYDPLTDELIDPYNGKGDMEQHLIRAVGDPHLRFTEDALRVMRAIRFVSQLGFGIEDATLKAIESHGHLIKEIAIERIRDEFNKMVMTNKPMEGVIMLQRVNLLQYIIPELIEGIGNEQNGAHIYDVWEHNLRAMQHAADKKWDLNVRLGALFHDIGKPATRKWSSERNDWTFYGHDVVGAKITKKVLEKMKYPSETVRVVTSLVRNHMFFVDIDKITLSAVRRLIASVGKDLVWYLMDVRVCDRIGMGRPVETPYRMRKYHSMIEEAMRAPVSVGMLKLDGSKLMEILEERPGPRIGLILHALFDEVLEDPSKNTIDELTRLAHNFAKLPLEDLVSRGTQGKMTKQKEEEREVLEIRKKYRVK